MKKPVLHFTVLTCILLLSAFCNQRKQLPVQTATTGQPGFAVVELFTSEGCSSCPAGERAVEELAKQYPGDVYVLAFHVDYWNRLGWMDSFSKPDYTARQNEYAARFNLESIYTPQAIVNGKREFVGSDKSQLQSAATAGLKVTPAGTIELTAAQTGKEEITVRYKTGSFAGGQLHIALVQNEAVTDVKAGENGGRKLHHMNVVRDFKTVSSNEGKTMVKLPAAVSLAAAKVIAYLQQKDGAIISVKQINVTGKQTGS